eukprot:3799566-Pyramimonas_sp.AAC.1
MSLVTSADVSHHQISQGGGTQTVAETVRAFKPNERLNGFAPCFLGVASLQTKECTGPVTARTPFSLKAEVLCTDMLASAALL